LIAGLVSNSLSRRILIDQNISDVQQYVEQVASFVENMISEYADLLEVIAQDPTINAVFSNPRTLQAEEEANLYNILYLLLAGKRVRPGLHVISGNGALILSTQPLPAQYDPVRYGNWGLFRRARESAGQPVIYAAGIRNRVGAREIAGIAKLVSNPEAEDFFVVVDLYREHIGSIVNFLLSGRTIAVDITDHQLIPFYTAGSAIPQERLDVYRRIIFHDEVINYSTRWPRTVPTNASVKT